MTWWKRAFGVDLFDTVVHLGITFALLVLVDENTHRGEPMVAIGIASATIFSVRRYFGLKRLRDLGAGNAETTTGVHRRLDTDSRLAELEGLYGRVADLEERLDFTERMLATKVEPAKLEGPRV